MSDDIDPVRRIRPDRLQSTDTNDPWMVAEARSKLQAVIDQRGPAPSSTTPAHTPTMYPRLAYEDEVAAVEFLTRVFGFRERRESRMDGDDEWGMLAWLEL